MADPCPEPENPEIEFEPIDDSGLPSDLTCSAAQGRVSNGIEIADISERYLYINHIFKISLIISYCHYDNLFFQAGDG